MFSYKELNVKAMTTCTQISPCTSEATDNKPRAENSLILQYTRPSASFAFTIMAIQHFFFLTQCICNQKLYSQWLEICMCHLGSCMLCANEIEKSLIVKRQASRLDCCHKSLCLCVKVSVVHLGGSVGSAESILV